MQADVYERIAASCLAVKRCVGMTTWGVSDKYSWIPGKSTLTFSGYTTPGLTFDRHMPRRRSSIDVGKELQEETSLLRLLEGYSE